MGPGGLGLGGLGPGGLGLGLGCGAMVVDWPCEPEAGAGAAAFLWVLSTTRMSTASAIDPNISRQHILERAFF